MNRKITTLAALAAVTLAGSAFAADDKAGIGIGVDANVSMTSTDKNADGKVSKAEAASNKELSSQFEKLDSNKDGNLDKGEFAKFEAKGKASMPGNKDGAPGKDEGDPATQIDRPGTTDDSTPGNEDKLGPGR